jgi:hypothetical protein
VALKINRKLKRRFDHTDEAAIRRERISGGRTKIVCINHADEDDPIRAAYVSGLLAGRAGEIPPAPPPPPPRSIAEGMRDLLAGKHRERIRIADVLTLFDIWIHQHSELAMAYENLCERIRVCLEDIGESELTPAKAAAQ